MLLRYLFLVEMTVHTLAVSLDSLGYSCAAKNSFRCKNSRCVDKAMRCDGKDDCFDGSDEFGCDQYLCKPPHFFKCKNDNCISHVFECDEENDCGDFSDEENCEDFKLAITVTANCTKGEWQCLDKLCIPEEWVCNGQEDCLDGSDELLGCTNTTCDDFRCKNGHCILNVWQCDGSNDCGDNSDETDCADHIDPEKCLLDDGFFLCANNYTCLKLSQTCDEIKQCPDGSDEGPGCHSPNNCEIKTCSHNCVQFPNGAKCLCPKGYHTIDDRSCTDINECEIYGICDHKCRNSQGSYECRCDNRYTLQEDKRTCKAEGGEAMMVFSSKSEIRGYFLTSKLYFPIAKRLKQVVGVGFDGHHVYWTDISSGHESITRSLEDGSNRELLVTAGLGAPEDLAIDWITGNIYFTDSEMQHIGVCSTDGHLCTVLVNTDIDKPRGIVLNPSEGEMYWSDWGTKPMIARSFMDGTHDGPFVSDDIEWPNGLAIDYPNERLYWVDAKRQTLESIRLDGTDRRIILKDIVKHPYAIAVFEDKLYWSDWSTHSIQTCDKFTGKNHHTVLKENKQYIYGIHVYHSAIKESSGNPCATAFCSDLCLLKGPRGFSCACTQDKVLSADKHVCAASDKKQMLIVGGKNILAEVEHRILGRHRLNVLHTIAKDIIALTYSSNNGTLFISDASTNTIIAMSLASGENNIVFHGEPGSKIKSLAYDEASNNLYWCDSGKGSVEILSLDTSARRILMYDMAGETPTSIAIVPEESVMFIAFKKTGKSSGYHIDRFGMDGTGRTHIIEQGLIGPITLFYEFGLHRIFWADAGSGLIETISVEGDGRHSFRSLHTSPVSLASLSQDLFWVNDMSTTLMWTDKRNINYDRKMHLDLPEGMESLRIVSVTPRPVVPHPCHANNGNCSHLCLPINSETKFTCACPLGMLLRTDNSTCYKPLQCTMGEFHCPMSDACISSTHVCNGQKDCLLGEDEWDCPDPEQCARHEFRCANGDCVREETVCDMHYDCADKSDEAADLCKDDAKGKKNKCPEGDFRCKSGMCIAERFICDGSKDCYDGEDEDDCEISTCTVGQFRCATGACIPKSWECDKQYDCYDLSDEHGGCSSATCSSDRYTCVNGRCVDISLKCDGNDDCGDTSDELNCGKTYPANECDDLEYQCDSNGTVCLPREAVCNGTIECPEGEDEQSCTDCKSNEFKCKNGRCLIKQWMCDGIDDCGDMSDEENDVCSRRNDTLHSVISPSKGSAWTNHSPCPNGFRCKNGNCVDLRFVCNGEEECYDGSDEYGACDTSCKADNNPCDQKCVKTPSGPMCACHSGYTLLRDGQTCMDVKECSQEPPICSQLCTEMPGSFSCGCREGYILRPDKRSCKSIGDPMSLIFVTGNQIRRLDELDNGLSVLYSDSTPKITGIDLSIAKNLVYFSIKESGTIHRLDINTYGREYMLNAGKPTKLATDWVTQNVYFADGSSYKSVIKVCNFDEKRMAILFTVETNLQISAIAVDPLNKYLFYATTEWRVFNSPSSSVWRRTLDGMKPTEVMKLSKGHVSGLTLDLYARKIYISDQHNGIIRKLDYESNTTGIVVFATDTMKLYGLNLYEDHLFFRTSGGYMGKCKLFGSEERTCDTFKIGGGADGDLFVVSQISRQPFVENTCIVANCTANICILADAGPKCLCLDGRTVRQGETCDVISKHEADEKSKPTFKKHQDLLQTPARHTSASAVIGVLVTLLVIVFAGLGYLYIRRRNTGRFDVSMKFYNPMFGVQPTDCVPQESGNRTDRLQPGEHEYCNPVHINSRDLEAATNAILEKVTPLVNIDK